MTEGRTRHYGEFYGLPDTAPADDRPLLLVLGNCQAESIRILLTDDAAPWRAVRIPPVHELEEPDLPHLARLMSRAGYLVSQPIRDDYRGLPLGTGQVRALQPAVTLALFPVLRYAGIYPWQAIVRHPSAPAAAPPVVAYHDLRTLVAAHQRTCLASSHRPLPAANVHDLAGRSIEELRSRETRHGTVMASNLLHAPSPSIFHTINHPGNAVLAAIATRLRTALGTPAEIAPPTEPLLGEVISPLEPDVIAALLPDAAPRDGWVVSGVPVTDEEVAQAQYAWYAEHPEFVDAGIARHADRIRLLGLL